MQFCAKILFNSTPNKSIHESAKRSSSAFLYVFVTMHGRDALLKAGILLMKCFWLFFPLI